MANGTVQSIRVNQSPHHSNEPDVETNIALSFEELDRITQVNEDFIPRWYQSESVQAIFDYFYQGGTGNPLIVAPTGAGKSHILGLFCKEVLARWPDQRILIITHVDTIIRQDYLALREHLPAGYVGIFSAGVGRKEKRRVTVAGIQSIAKKSHFFKDATIILIDEAHTVPPKGEGQYRTFLANFETPIVGLTATHFRLGTGYLHQGEGRIFTDIAYDIDIIRLIDEGYLCPLIPKEPGELIDMEGVHTQGGEFVQKETKERVTREGLTESIVAGLQQYKERYIHWLLFAVDIEHAEYLTILLNESGIATGIVHSKQTKKENEAIKLDFKNRRYQALVSVESLTTGFDVPTVDLIALLRPTKSPVLHIQMIGRGLRIAPDKEHCLVLDYAGNLDRLGPINDVHVTPRKKGKKGAPPIMKTCPECKTKSPGSVRICPTCGHEFEFKQKLKDISSDKEIVQRKKKKKIVHEPHWYEVTSTNYSVYNGKSGITMQIAYRCGIRTFFEYKQFDISTKAGYHSRFWWKNRCKNESLPPPINSQEAVLKAQNGDLKTPHAINVLEGGKYPAIKSIVFKEG